MLHIKSFIQCLLLGLLGLALSACGGGGGNSGGSGSSTSSSSTPAATYTVSGAISGLTASGMVLQLNGAGNVTVANGATNFAFATTLNSGQTYAVTINTQPTGLTCTLVNATSTIGSANVTNVAITCTPNTYTVTTSIAGLTAGGLTLQLNANSSVPVSSGATSFTFPTTLSSAQNYGVSIISQPTGLTCAVANGTGTIAAANVTNVAITCITTPTYTVTANLTGLTTSGLVLQLNSANNATIASGATSYAFPALSSSLPYSVSVLTQPTGLTCTPGVTNGPGSTTNVSVAIACVTTPASTYSVSGTISGLNASGLVLTLNIGTGATVSTYSAPSGATNFTFAGRLSAGQSYNVNIASPSHQPTGQTCTATSNNGSNVSANVTNVVITCVTNPNTTVSGSISGLTASGLKLTLSSYGSTGTLTQVEELPLASGASTFQFANTFTSLTAVAVRVSAQPTGLTCILANAGGVVGNANLITPQVRCGSRTINPLTGTYRLSAVNGVSVVDTEIFATFFADGSYTFALHNKDVSIIETDVEYGLYTWNQTTGAFTTPLVAVDSNTNAGLGSDSACCTRTASRSGSTLTLVNVEGAVTDTYTFTAVTNVSGSLTGSWLFPNSPNGHDFIVFMANGTYMWINSNVLISNNSTTTPAAYNGLENACYTYTASTLTPTFSGCLVGTTLMGINANGNPGFILNSGVINSAAVPASYSISSDTMTWVNSNGNTALLTRITN